MINYNVKNRLMFEYKNRYHIGLGSFNAAMEIVNVLEQGASVKNAVKLLKDINLANLSNLEISEIVASIHPKGLEFYETIKGKPLIETENVCLLSKKLPLYAMMNYYTEEDMKKQLLDVLMFTNSTIRYNELGLILSKEAIRPLNKAIEDRTLFAIKKDDNDNYLITTYYKHNADCSVSLDVNAINFEQLVKLAGFSVKAHINSADLNKNDYLTIRETKILLNSMLITIYFLLQNIENKNNGIIKEPALYKLINVPFDNFSEEEIDNLKKYAVDIKYIANIDFEQIAEALVKAFQEGNNIKIAVNGITYYSCEAKSIDAVYNK